VLGGLRAPVAVEQLVVLALVGGLLAVFAGLLFPVLRKRGDLENTGEARPAFIEVKSVIGNPTLSVISNRDYYNKTAGPVATGPAALLQ
jgi:hypothetical protein